MLGLLLRFTTPVAVVVVDRSRQALGRRPLDDRGEGVISAAIAVLIMAFLGAAMWVGFDVIWDDTEDNIGDQVDQIGR